MIAAPPSLRRPTLLERLSQHTPIYLLSALCMLGSCVLLANDTNGQSVSVPQIVSLVLALAFYQLCMFALAAFLMLKRGVMRDGRILLVLDAIFFCDVTFANSNLITANLWLGLAIFGGLMVLTAARVHWLAARLGAHLPLRLFAGLLAAMLLLVATPAWLKHLDLDHAVTAGWLYLLWWIAGLLAAASLVLEEFSSRRAGEAAKSPGAPRRAGEAARSPGAPRLAPAYLSIAWLSVIAHLGFLHYVYDITFFMAMLTPMLLAAAMLTRRLAVRHQWGLQDAPAIAPIAIALAGLFSLERSRVLEWDIPWSTTQVVRPLLLTVIGCYLVTVYLYLRRHAWRWLAAGAAAGLLYVFGPTASQIWSFVAAIARAIGRTLDRLLPKTRLAWGILGVVVSFLLLGLGAWVSLRKPPDAQRRQSADSPAGPSPAAPPTASEASLEAAAEPVAAPAASEEGAPISADMPPQPPARQAPQKTSATTLFVAVIILVFVVWAMIPSHHHGGTADRAKCSNNLRQIGLALTMYANENRQHYPHDERLLIPTQGLSADVFFCPAGPEPRGSTTPARRLESGERQYIYVGAQLTSAAASDVVVAFELPENHRRDGDLTGGNVLFGDAHVEWMGQEQLMQLGPELEALHNPPQFKQLTQREAEQLYSDWWKPRQTDLASGIWSEKLASQAPGSSVIVTPKE